eukprot:CAMPEP_0177654036 /NCGR_PEP_ID=MMETSP0447-20121125/14080_1 /TAXON_ID=0 /ORGANISM="Stygamoeba regulata, Strain BSH-02190019" /LENGTH=469 /DNA_ID=CAMNT_0019157583 /DNA_START=29 /DNA_END=1439 /DNA_ORIENTATION=-
MCTVSPPPHASLRLRQTGCSLSMCTVSPPPHASLRLRQTGCSLISAPYGENSHLALSTRSYAQVTEIRPNAGAGSAGPPRPSTVIESAAASLAGSGAGVPATAAATAPRARFRRVRVDEEYAGMRLDRFVRLLTVDAPQSLLQRLLRKREIVLSARSLPEGGDAAEVRAASLVPSGSRSALQPSRRLELGQYVYLPAHLTSSAPTKGSGEKNMAVSKKDIQEIRKAILYKDNDLIAINKPSGWAVQGGSGIAKSIDDLLPYLVKEGEKPPRIVHRIDKWTSGVLLLARTRQAAQEITKMFKDRQLINKVYWAVVLGKPKPQSGLIKMPLERVRVNNEDKMMQRESLSDGKLTKMAITQYKTLRSAGREYSLLELIPETGRTHQLRAHCLYAIHAPIVGDRKYLGNYHSTTSALESHLPKEDLSNYYLHAKHISLPSPSDPKQRIRIEAPVPPRMKRLLSFLGLDETPKK